MNERALPEGARVLVVGCGYLGLRVAEALVCRGMTVTGTTRSEKRFDEIEACGVEAAIVELATPQRSSALESAYDAVIFSAAAGRGSERAQLVYADGPSAVLDVLDVLDAGQAPEAPSSRDPRIVFISSTGVYAQRDGSTVNEESPALSERGSHLAILAGEGRLLARGASVLRLGGLYGPGRSPVDWMRRPRFRSRLEGSARALMNWIHIDDAARATIAVLEGGAPGEIYLGVDGQAIRRGELYARAAELAGVLPPQLEESSPDLGKRCDPTKLEALGFTSEHPDLRRALEEIEALRELNETDETDEDGS